MYINNCSIRIAVISALFILRVTSVNYVRGHWDKKMPKDGASSNSRSKAFESAFDKASRRNSLSLEAYRDELAHRPNSNKYLLHEDAKTLPELVEGDMLLDDKDREFLQATNKTRGNTQNAAKRSMTMYAEKLWISRIVPYEFQHPGTINYNSAEVREAVEDAFHQIESISCIRFRPKRSSDSNWLKFIKGSGCYSGVGRKYWTNAATDVSLGDWCVHPAIVEHELLHALGFFHEQSRPDRDSYVKIYWHNIVDSMKSNFDRHKAYDSTIQDTKYDYQSIMHYGKTAFTKNGDDTIEAKFDPNQPLGGDFISLLDETELNKMYQCKKDPNALTDPWSTWGEWAADCYDDWKRGCTTIRQRFCLTEHLDLCPGVNEYGTEDEYKACPAANCTFEMMQPQWGMWASYGPCSLACGEGYQVRTRKCDNPPPHHGLNCKGHSTQTSICRIRKCHKSPFDTNFDSGTISPWKQDYSERMDWKITSGATPNPSSGPESDHTTGKGKYAYISAKDSYVDSNHLGRLVSPIVQANSGPKCMTFFYQMNGKYIAYLDVYIKMLGVHEYFTYWQKDGHQGNYWERGVLEIPNKQNSYEIIIEGKLGLAPHADIAIDDIQVDSRKCIPGSEGCLDHYKHCDVWRLHGECHKNYRWMLRACCSTCSGMDECENKKPDWHCKHWANLQYCKKTPKWMWLNCCKSCRDCVDKHPYCKWWADRGECDKSAWMKQNCKNVCGICKA